MTKTSRYPKFHKYVTRAYLIIICILAISLPTSYLIKKQPTLKEIVGIIVGVLIFYVIYWLIVRLNCYGTPLQERTPTSNNNNSNNNNNHNSTSSSRSSSNGGGSNSNNHPTFANYRLAGLSERLRRFGSNQSNNSSSTNEEDDLEEALRPPPPTYNTALEGAGLPPPYMNDFIEINVHNSESNGGSNGNASLPQMSERVPPRRPVPSVPSSSSLRRPVPPIPPQPQSTLQDNSSPTMIDSSPRRPVPQTPRRPVPSIPTSTSTTSLSSDNKPQQPRRAVPSVPASSSSSSSSSRLS